MVIKLTNLWTLNDNTYLTGIVLDCQDPTGEPCFKIGEELVEVIQL